MSDEIINEIKNPYETDRASRRMWTAIWTVICLGVFLTQIFVYFYIGSLGLIFLGLTIIGWIIGVAVMLEHDPFPRSITAVSDIPIMGWGNHVDCVPKEGKTKVLCENNMIWGKRLWLSGKPWRITNAMTSLVDLNKSIKKAVGNLSVARDSLKKAKIGVSDEIKKQIDEMAIGLHEITDIVKVNPQKEPEPNGKLTNLPANIKVFHDAIKLPDNKWHPFYMIGETDFRNRGEVIAQVKAGQTVKLDGSFFTFHGSEFDAEIFKGKLPNPTIWFVPREVLSPAEADAKEARSYSDFIVNYNSRVLYQGKIIDLQDVLLKAKDLVFEYLQNVTTLTKSQIKAAARKAGKTEEDTLAELKKLKARLEGTNKVLKSVWKWINEHKAVKIGLVLLGIYIVAHFLHFI